ncbi:MAG: DUF971 domain-containing protein [Gammaproteobacteria bacterium]|nr:DUF971 domain-containing protein [Gammaproteobacteria bacterium]
MNPRPKPVEIKQLTQSRCLEITYDNGRCFSLPWEYLRVFSPSMEVRARRGRERLLVTGKQDVVIDRIEPMGNYAVKLYFNDGHKSGIYDWSYLYGLGENQRENWEAHLNRLESEAVGGQA